MKAFWFSLAFASVISPTIVFAQTSAPARPSPQQQPDHDTDTPSCCQAARGALSRFSDPRIPKLIEETIRRARAEWTIDAYLLQILNGPQANGQSAVKRPTEYQNTIFAETMSITPFRNVKAWAEKGPFDDGKAIALKFCGEGFRHYANYSRWEPFVILVDMNSNVRFINTNSTASRWAESLKKGTDPSVRQAVEEAASEAMGYNMAININCSSHANDETDGVDYSRALSPDPRASSRP